MTPSKRFHEALLAYLVKDRPGPALTREYVEAAKECGIIKPDDHPGVTVVILQGLTNMHADIRKRGNEHFVRFINQYQQVIKELT